MKKQAGFSILQILLVVVIAGVIGGTGWYVWQSKNKTNSTLSETAKSGTQPQKTETSKTETDPTADWVEVINTEGIFTFKRPRGWVSKNCESATLVGANTDSVGHCASEDGGQMIVSSIAGELDSPSTLGPNDYNDVKTSVLAVDGVQGSRSEGTAKAPAADAAIAGYPEGTKVVSYTFAGKNNRTYTATYVQKAGYPNGLADFDTMVTKTLKFSL